MTKDEIINVLASINFVCKNEQDDIDRENFEPIINRCPRIGSECLKMWMSKYFVSFRSKALIDKYELEPTWDNFHHAAHFLMLDRIMAAVALNGQVTSKVQECIDLTLKCGNIDSTTLMWVEFYCNSPSEQMAS